MPAHKIPLLIISLCEGLISCNFNTVYHPKTTTFSKESLKALFRWESKKNNKKQTHQNPHKTSTPDGVKKVSLSYRLTIQKWMEKYNKRQSITLVPVITNENELLPDVAAYKEVWDTRHAWWLHSGTTQQGPIHTLPRDLTRDNKPVKRSPMTAPYGYDHPMLRNLCC